MTPFHALHHDGLLILPNAWDGGSAALMRSLEAAGVKAQIVTVPPGEGSKSFAELERVLDRLLVAASRHPMAFASVKNLEWRIVRAWRRAARLLPADAETYAALLAASVAHENPQVNPRVDPTVIPTAPWTTGLPINFAAVRASSGVDLSPALHDPVADLGLNDFRRVLAVVHRGRLGEPCTGVALARNRFGYRPQVQARQTDGTVRDLPERGNVAFDAQCPVQGPTVYLAPFRDHDRWTLHLLQGAPP